jgi:hypothetical protein
MIEGEMKELTTKDDELMVLIPVKEYRKLIKKVEKLKAEKIVERRIAADAKQKSDYYRWWQEEEDKREALEVECKELRKNLDDAKAQIQSLIGLDEQVKEQE